MVWGGRSWPAAGSAEELTEQRVCTTRNVPAPQPVRGRLPALLYFTLVPCEQPAPAQPLLQPSLWGVPGWSHCGMSGNLWQGDFLLDLLPLLPLPSASRSQIWFPKPHHVPGSQSPPVLAQVAAPGVSQAPVQGLPWRWHLWAGRMLQDSWGVMCQQCHCPILCAACGHSPQDMVPTEPSQRGTEITVSDKCFPFVLLSHMFSSAPCTSSSCLASGCRLQWGWCGRRPGTAHTQRGFP